MGIRRLCEIKFDDNSDLNVTWEHPIYTLEGLKAIRPEMSPKNEELNLTKLKVGGYVFTSNNIFDSYSLHYYPQVKRITSISCKKEIIQTYNLINLIPYNNYYADDVLVHNKGGGGVEHPLP